MITSGKGFFSSFEFILILVKVPPWPLKIQWYNKEGEVTEGGRYHIMADGLGTYSIRIDPIEGGDDGQWKCVATSDQQAKAFTTATLQVICKYVSI